MSNLPSWKETTWTSPEVPGSIAWRTAVDIAGNVLYGISNGLKSSFPTDRTSRLPEAIDTVSDVANANVSQTERENCEARSIKSWRLPYWRNSITKCTNM